MNFIKYLKCKSNEKKYKKISLTFLHGENFIKNIPGGEGEILDDNTFNKFYEETAEMFAAARNFKEKQTYLNKMWLLDEMLDLQQTITTIMSNNFTEFEIKQMNKNNIIKNESRIRNNHNFKKKEVD